jgi:hypothetical protein
VALCSYTLTRERLVNGIARSGKWLDGGGETGHEDLLSV